MLEYKKCEEMVLVLVYYKIKLKNAQNLDNSSILHWL